MWEKHIIKPRKSFSKNVARAIACWTRKETVPFWIQSRLIAMHLTEQTSSLELLSGKFWEYMATRVVTRSACKIFKTRRKAKEPPERSNAHWGLCAKYSIEWATTATNIPSIFYAPPKVILSTNWQNVEKKKILLRYLRLFGKHG